MEAKEKSWIVLKTALRGYISEAWGSFPRPHSSCGDIALADLIICSADSMASNLFPAKEKAMKPSSGQAFSGDWLPGPGFGAIPSLAKPTWSLRRRFGRSVSRRLGSDLERAKVEEIEARAPDLGVRPTGTGQIF